MHVNSSNRPLPSTSRPSHLATLPRSISSEQKSGRRSTASSPTCLLTQGSYATQGKAVIALIDSDSYRVDAYFEETKVPRIKIGSPADVRLMDGAAMIKGKVESIARGITDQDNKDGPELLATVNPTFTWVRLAQRIPVRIHLTDVPEGVLISAGMTCTVILNNGA